MTQSSSPPLTRTDAYLMVAVTEARRSGSIRLGDLIADYDYLDHSIPTFDDVSFGLRRLQAAGYVTVEICQRRDHRPVDPSGSLVVSHHRAQGSRWRTGGHGVRGRGDAVSGARERGPEPRTSRWPPTGRLDCRGAGVPRVVGLRIFQVPRRARHSLRRSRGPDRREMAPSRSVLRCGMGRQAEDDELHDEVADARASRGRPRRSLRVR